MRPRFEFVCFRDMQEEQTEDWGTGRALEHRAASVPASLALIIFLTLSPGQNFFYENKGPNL